MTVHSNRTESLDASHVEIQFARVALPRECDIIRQFAEHCANTAKKLEEDAETGPSATSTSGWDRITSAMLSTTRLWRGSTELPGGLPITT